MVKQCGQNRLNAEREGANLEFQVATNPEKNVIHPLLLMTSSHLFNLVLRVSLLPAAGERETWDRGCHLLSTAPQN